jgi:chitin synthase
MLSQNVVKVFTLCREQKDAQPDYERFATGWRDSTSQTSILTCLTMYNESGIELVRSLAGLSRNAEDLRHHATDLDALDFTVCMIADGQDNLHPTTLYWAIRLGLLPEDYDSITSGHPRSPDGVTVFEVELSTARVAEIATEVADTLNLPMNELLRQQGIQTPEEGSSRPMRACIFRALFCIKAENMGKLDSHWWFFDRLCPIIQPDYCIQMDVGTVPADQTVRHLWETLEQNDTCAAASACILSSPPSHPWKALQAWQYATFVWDKTIDWPVQALCGYLEVVPGQFCILRWRALSSNAEPNERTKDSPLSHYFRGLQALSPLESNLFLAEDRVLGFELISQRQTDWTIRYVPDAVAVTDECKSLSELLRQRRRWINSGSIAKLWAFLHLGRYWVQSDSRMTRKLGILSSMSWSMLLFVMEWFLPSLSFTLLLSLSTSSVFVENLVLAKAVQSAVFTFGMLWLVQFLLCMRKQLISKWIEFWLHLTLLLQVFIILFLIVVVVLIKPVVLWLPLLALTVGVPLITVSKFSNSVFKRMLPLALGYAMLGGVINLLLMTYAIVNLQDCSWGTKGLHSENPKACKQSLKRHYFSFFRDQVIVLFLLIGAVASLLFLIGKLSMMHLLMVFCCVCVTSLVLRLSRGFHKVSRKEQFLIFRNDVVTAWLLTNAGVVLAFASLQSGIVVGYIYAVKTAIGAVCGLLLFTGARKLKSTGFYSGSSSINL